jgi:hypothetical protein
MARYFEIDDITFTDINSNNIKIKDIREMPEYNTLANYDIQNNDDLDEIVSRGNYYGEGAEDLTYSLAEHNKVKLDENDYTLANLKNILIPVVD